MIIGDVMAKKKITLTVDDIVVDKAKKKSRELGLSISRIVENALNFFANPSVYCFKCGQKFLIKLSVMCPRCSWYKCPKCGACACKLGDEGIKVAYFMRKTLIEIFASPEV